MNNQTDNIKDTFLQNCNSATNAELTTLASALATVVSDLYAELTAAKAALLMIAEDASRKQAERLDMIKRMAELAASRAEKTIAKIDALKK